MTTTLARRELLVLCDQVTILKNVVAEDRLDMIAATVIRMELSIRRLESIEYLFSPSSQ